MKNQMHTWVNELMGTWLDQVYDPELLDDWIHQIELRKKTLGIISEEALANKLKSALKDCKRGDVIWTMRSLQEKHRSDGTKIAHKVRLESKPESFWHEATFIQYQPRKEILWLGVPWPTHGTSKQWARGLWLISLHGDGGLLKYEPSKTEYKVRLANKDRLQRRA
jgi:hypothetical protein